MTDYHEHYDHYDEKMIYRLDRFYGDVELEMNKKIQENIHGKSVLDIGCGFGSLVNFLQKKGFQALGIDQHLPSIEAGKKHFPNANLKVSSGSLMEFPDDSFDTIIMKDVIHHIYEEDDAHSFLQEIKRICRNRLIIVDPNPTFILKLCRRIIGHIDPVCPPDEAIKLLSESGFNVKKIFFSDLIAFPLSGGYVSKDFVQYGFLKDTVMFFEKVFSKIFDFLKLSSIFCWRCYVIADVKK